MNSSFVYTTNLTNSLRKYLQAYFAVQCFKFSRRCPNVGSPWIVGKAMCVVKYYGSFFLNVEVYVRNGTYFTIKFHFKTLSSPFFDDNFCKLEAAKSVTYVYQDSAQLNILTVENCNIF